MYVYDVLNAWVTTAIVMCIHVCIIKYSIDLIVGRGVPLMSFIAYKINPGHT